MTAFRSTSLVAGLLLCSSTAIAQAPINNDCVNASAIAVGTTAFSTVGATTDGIVLNVAVCDLGPFGSEQIENDIWYCFAAPTTDNYDVTTYGLAGFDTRLAVYDNACGTDDPNLVVACNDDFDGNSPFEAGLTFAAVSGTSYKIRLGGFGTGTFGSGSLLIQINVPPTAPANDDCINAAVIGLGSTPIDTSNASLDGMALDILVCDMGPSVDERIYNDLWFLFTAPTTGSYDIDTGNATGFDSRLAVYNQSTCPDSPANVIGCDDDTLGLQSLVQVNLTLGTTYLIRVGSDDPLDSGTGNLTIGATPPPPANDDCGNAQVVMLGLTSFDTTAATNGSGLPLDPLVCDMGFAGDDQIYADIWFLFTPLVTGSFDIASVNNGNPINYDSRLAVYNQSTCPDNPANVIACDDDDGPGLEAFSPNVPLVAGTSYLIRVGSFSATSSEQPAALSIQMTPPPPTNDDCVNALVVTVGLTPFDNTQATDGAGLALDPLVCDMGTAGDDQIYQDTWYSFTPTMTGFYDIASVNNGNPLNYDSRLAVYDQSTCPDDPNNVIGCDDDDGPGLEAFAPGVSMTAGTTYLIRVGSFSAFTTEQPAALSIQLGTPPPPPPANDDCVNAEVIAGFGTYAYDNTLATTDGADLFGFCDFGTSDDLAYEDVWFEYTATTGGCTYISTLGLVTWDSRIVVYDSTTCPDDPATVLACSDAEMQPIVSPFEAGLDVDLVTGSTYLIRVGNFQVGTVGGAGSIFFGPGPVAEGNGGNLQAGVDGCSPAPAFPEGCNGDGGDQMGCTDCPCGNNSPVGTIGGCLNSALTSSRLLPSGSTSVSLPSGDTSDLRFGLSGAPATAFCILNSGDNVAPQGMANPCFGLNSGAQSSTFDGLRCAVQNTLRHGGRSADINGDVGVTNNPWGGEGGPPVGLAVAGAGFSAGQTRYFQVIHRDDPLAVCGRGLNTTQFVEVTFAP